MLVYTKKLPLANSKWNCATGCKKCHGKKALLKSPIKLKTDFNYWWFLVFRNFTTTKIDLCSDASSPPPLPCLKVKILKMVGGGCM